jgi:hydroxypyruvate isomerase
MAGIRQSAAWWCFVQDGLLTPQAFVAMCADIGFGAVELPDEGYFPLIRDAGLGISALRGHDSIESGLNREANHERIIRELEASIRLASDWGVPHLICFSGSRGDLDDDRAVEAMVRGLARAAPLAESAGVTLALELLNSRVDHPDYQCDRTSFGLRVVEGVGSPAVKLLYDIYHMQIMEGDIIRTIGRHHAAFAHYHTAGNPGRNELNDAQELHYPAIFQAIAATGYAGFITHEFIPTGDPRAGLEQAFAMTAAAFAGRA